MKSILHVFANRRMALVLVLGFSSGLPLALTGGTLQAWLTDAKVDLSTIGRFALIGLPYTLKFLWSPLLDSFAPPILGRRRGWALLSQAGLAASIAWLALMDPAQGLLLFSVAAFFVAFFSASQDIVLDAFRTEILKSDELGAGAGVYVMGYRLALLVSGAAALGLADHFTWRWVYLLMAAILGIGMVTVFFADEPKIAAPPARSFADRVILPFADFFKRPGAMEILIFVMIYKLSTMMATSLTTTFLMSLNFTKTEIGAVTKVFGLIATIVGTLAGGALMTRLGMKRSLWLFGLLQGLAGLSFLVLAEVGHHRGAMIAVITVENFMIGLGVAAISGFMMQVCSRQFTGTQFALLSSLTAVSRVILVSQAGNIATALGWPLFFVFSVFLAIPGLLLLRRFDRWAGPSKAMVNANLSRWDITTICLFIGGLVGIALEPLLGTWLAWTGAGAVLLGITAGLAKPKRAAS